MGPVRAPAFRRVLLLALVGVALPASPGAAGGDPPAPPPAPPPAGQPAADPPDPAAERERRRLELERLREGLPAAALPAMEELDRFRDREFRVWATLRDRVVAHGATALPALRVSLKELDWEVRAFAASCLARIGDAGAAADLAEAYAGESFTEARRQMVLALATLRAASGADALRRAAAERDPGIRLAGVRGLAHLPAPRAEDLLPFAQDDDLDVRYEARGGLAALEHAGTVEALLAEADALVADRGARRAHSENPEDNGERYAQYLLGIAMARGRDKRMDRALLAVVRAEKPWDRKEFFRMGAAEGLGRRAGEGGPLAPEIASGITDRDDRVRVACTYAAGFVGSAELAPRLAKALGDSQLDVRHNAVVALGRIGTKDAAKYLVHALRDRAGEIRIGAVRALGGIAQPEATAGLVTALRDGKYMIRVLAAKMLSDRTAADGVVDGLRRAAKDPDFGVRAQAIASLAHVADGTPLLEDFVTALGDTDEGVRASGCLALASVRGSAPVASHDGAAKRVTALYLRAPERRVYRASLEFLDAVRPPPAVEPLLAALEDGDVEVRRRANLALQKMSETGRNFDPEGSAADREAAVKRWREWWASRDGKLPARGSRARIAVTGEFVEAARDLKWKGLDIALLFDSTGSMAALISAAKERVDEIIAQLEGLLPSLRVSVYTYRDFGDDYVYYGTPLTYDTGRLRGFLQNAVHGQGGDIPEAVFETVKTATRSLKWREESHKVVVYAGDAPHHPELDGAFTALIGKFFTAQNRAVLHAVFTDTNRRSLDIAARKERSDPDRFRNPFFEVYKRTAQAGRGRGVLLDDESALIKEMLVLTFGEAWRADIENLLDFEF